MICGPRERSSWTKEDREMAEAEADGWYEHADRTDQSPDAGTGQGCFGGDSDGGVGAVEVPFPFLGMNGIYRWLTYIE